MPKIFQYFSYLFYIYVDDHLPIHVHVKIQGREGKFSLIYNNGVLSIVHKHIKRKPKLHSTEITETKRFVRKHSNKIKVQWETIHYYKKQVKCIVVRRKV